jgi:ABC-2 type transport system permease protein
MVLAFLLLSLPSLIVTILLGPLLLEIPVNLDPLIVAVLPLCAMPLAGVGAMLGLVGRTPAESGNLTFLLTLGMTVLGPVVAPPDHLPRFLVWLGHLSPATYAASALRQTVVGPVEGRIVIDLAVLGGGAVLSLWLVGHKMGWRQG